MSKFQLLSAAALSSLIAAAAGGDRDEDAGPLPPENGEDAGNDAGEDKTGEGADKGGEPGKTGSADTAAHVLAADAVSAAAAADAAGFARANTRVAEVFASEEAKADPSLAAFMLTKSSATSAEIIADLKARGPAPAAAAPPSAPIPDTGVDLGRGTDAKAIADDGKKGKVEEGDGWDTAIAESGPSIGMYAPPAPVVPASAAAAAQAAAAGGASFVNSSAVPPTGN